MSDRGSEYQATYASLSREVAELRGLLGDFQRAVLGRVEDLESAGPTKASVVVVAELMERVDRLESSRPEVEAEDQLGLEDELASIRSEVEGLQDRVAGLLRSDLSRSESVAGPTSEAGRGVSRSARPGGSPPPFTLPSGARVDLGGQPSLEATPGHIELGASRASEPLPGSSPRSRGEKGKSSFLDEPDPTLEGPPNVIVADGWVGLSGRKLREMKAENARRVEAWRSKMEFRNRVLEQARRVAISKGALVAAQAIHERKFTPRSSDEAYARERGDL